MYILVTYKFLQGRKLEELDTYLHFYKINNKSIPDEI